MADDTELLPSSPPAATRIAWRLEPRQVFANISAGIIVGLLATVLQISLAALIFSGPLAARTGDGIGFMLFGACAMGLIVALASSRPGLIAVPQNVTGAILALATAGIAAGAPGRAAGAAEFATVVGAVVVASLITGALFLALGYFRLGALIRFLPYPVVGGFLAGTGWLLLLGGLGVMIGAVPPLARLASLAQPDVLREWLPGFVFAVLLLLALRRFRHFMIMPAMFLLAFTLFYALLWLTSTPVAVASARGWLLGPFPRGALWRPLDLGLLAHIRWPAIAAQLDKIGIVAILAAVCLLLNASGLELALRQDFDLNRELRAAGLANMVAGLGGAAPGFQALSFSTLSYRMGGGSRLTSVVAALVAGAFLVAGAQVLAFVPKLVIGGALIYLGLAFLTEWLYDAWFRLPRLDYALVLVILAMIAFVGLLEGVVLGLAIAVALFVVSYGGVDVVKHAFSGASVRSRVTRGGRQRLLLSEHGERIYALQLQGFVFFGTANGLFERVRQRLLDTRLEPARFVLLDFRQVTGVDATALLSFAKLRQLVRDSGVDLLLTNLAPALRERIARSLVAGEIDGAIRFFPDLDRGLEWCENAILESERADVETRQALAEQFAEVAPSSADLPALMAYLERREIERGGYLIHQGDLSDVIFFVESGQVTAQIESAPGEPVRLETMRGGRVVGELGFYLGSRRSAAVVADEPSVVYRLALGDLRRMERDDPAAAAAFHQIVARLLAERVAHLVTTVDALQR